MPVYRLMSNTLSNIANEEELAVVHSKDVVNILSYILDQQKVLEKKLVRIEKSVGIKIYTTVLYV